MLSIVPTIVLSLRGVVLQTYRCFMVSVLCSYGSIICLCRVFLDWVFPKQLVAIKFEKHRLVLFYWLLKFVVRYLNGTL